MSEFRLRMDGESISGCLFVGTFMSLVCLFF